MIGTRAPVIVFFALLLAGAHLAAGSNIGIRYDSRADQTLRRLAERSGVALPDSWYMKPTPAADLVAFIDSVHAAGVLLTETEMREAGALQSRIDGARNLWGWQNAARAVQASCNLSLLGHINTAYEDSAILGLRGIIRPSLRISAGDFSFYSSLDVWTDYRSDTLFTPSSYEPFDGIPYNLYGRADSSSVRSSDSFRGGVVWRTGPFLLETAVDYLRQGPAVFFPLTFSGQAPPITYFRGRFDIGPVHYTHTVGQLKCQRDKPKYLYTHRLQFETWGERITAAISEVIVNGSVAEDAQSDSLRAEYYGQERGWEWVYLIPFIPYSFAEHYIGDRDNAALAFDITLSVPRSFRWYLEIFLDDVTATIWTDDWGNKWAATVGGEYFGCIAGRDVHALIEYSRVEPWVYTHFYGGSHRYAHFDKPLGAPGGPNSDGLAFQTVVTVSPLHAAGIRFSMARKGAGRGSSILDVFRDGVDSPSKTFLGETASSRTAFAGIWQFNRFGLFAIDASAGYRSGAGPFVSVEGGFAF